MKVIIKQIDDRKGTMYEMYMSYSALHRKKEDISKRKTVIVYERRFMILL